MALGSWLFSDQVFSGTLGLRVRALLLRKAPGAVPIRAGRTQSQLIKAIDEGCRWAIIGDDSERRLKRAAGLIPLPAPVAGQSFRETITQLKLRRRELTLAPHDLKYGLRLILAQHGNSIDLARLHSLGRAGDSRLRYQNAAAIFLVGPFQAGSEINGVAHHGVVHHQLGADAADEHVTGSDADPQVE